jgi:hypothetical protein
MRIFILTLLVFCFLTPGNKASAQLNGISGGLVFSSGVEYSIGKSGETGTTANPGLFGKGYLKINKRFNIVPSLLAFKPYKKTDINTYELNTYMFQGDIDCVYGIFKDKYVRLTGYTGFNASAVMLKWKIMQETPFTKLVSDNTNIKPGLNLGAALQLYVNDAFDGYLSAKYVVSSYNQFVINIGVIYFPGGKHRKGSW